MERIKIKGSEWNFDYATAKEEVIPISDDDEITDIKKEPTFTYTPPISKSGMIHILYLNL